MKLFLVPKTGRVKDDAPRPLTLDESLVLLEKKFSKPRAKKAKRVHVVETVNFFGDFDGDDAA